MDYNTKLLEADFVQDVRTKLPRHPSKQWSTRDADLLVGACYHQSLEEYGRVRGNARYHCGPNHISSNGLPGLSYTLFVEPDGVAYLANDVESRTYSQGYRNIAGDENVLYIGVCFGGNFKGPGHDVGRAPTPRQIETAEHLWHHMADIWGWSADCLYGHCEFGKPACPGYDLMEVIDSIRPRRFASATERQRFLMKMGYYKAVVDGIWGPLSKAALVMFQRDAGLDPDGVWGRKTSMAARETFG